MPRNEAAYVFWNSHIRMFFKTDCCHCTLFAHFCHFIRRGRFVMSSYLWIFSQYSFNHFMDFSMKLIMDIVLPCPFLICYHQCQHGSSAGCWG